uniref:MADF domain-containing protein n=1 Tax=Ditylenchus dipsaci TaxID=166011 RepID=A0A915D3C0_9BILA
MNPFPPPGYEWKFIRSVASLAELPYIEHTHRVRKDARTYHQNRWRFRCCFGDCQDMQSRCPFKMYLVLSADTFDLFACGDHEHKKVVSGSEKVANEKSEHDISLDKSSFIKYLSSNSSKFRKKISKAERHSREQDTFTLIKLVKAETPLYDRNMRANKNSDGTKYAWQRIAKSLTFYSDVKSAHTKWYNLIRYYKIELAKMKKKLKDTGKVYKSTWPYYDAMKWMGKYLSPYYNCPFGEDEQQIGVGDMLMQEQQHQLPDDFDDKEEDMMPSSSCKPGKTTANMRTNVPFEDNQFNSSEEADESESSEWVFLRRVANETELQAVRREMKLAVERKTYIEKDDFYELFCSGKHNHTRKTKISLKDIKPRKSHNNSSKKKKKVKFDLSANVTKSFDPTDKEESNNEANKSDSMELIANSFIPDVNNPHKWKFFSVYTENEWTLVEKSLGIQYRRNQSKAIEFGIHKNICRLPNVHNHAKDGTPNQQLDIVETDRLRDNVSEANTSKQDDSSNNHILSEMNPTFEKPSSIVVLDEVLVLHNKR